MARTEDIEATSLERLVSQYDGSTRLRALVSGFAGMAEELRTAIESIAVLRVIANASGDALDVIGEILGQPREIANIVPIDYFSLRDVGVAGDPSKGFGDQAAPGGGARFRSANEPPDGSALLSDAEYRPLLVAKILRNRTRGTPEDIIASIQSVLPDSPAVHLTRGTATVAAEVQRALTATEQLLLDAQVGIRGEIPLIPRPTAVALTITGL